MAGIKSGLNWTKINELSYTWPSVDTQKLIEKEIECKLLLVSKE